MKSIITTLCFLSVFFISSNAQKFYVGTFTNQGSEGIYLCEFNSETGDIELNKTFKGIDNPSFLKVSPNKKFLYVVSRAPQKVSEDGSVYAYKIQDDGSLAFINKQFSNGQAPCHVDVSNDGKYVAIATYTGGTYSLFLTKKNGALLAANSVIINEGSSVNKNRQQEPHAHSIKFSNFNDLVFGADLGTDQLDIFKLKDGQLTASSQKFIKLPEGSGPRHFDFHPKDNIIFIINELNSTISTAKKTNSNWKITQTISTLSDDFKGDSYCADIHVSNDGRFLYASNRGENTIAVFVIEANSKRLFKVANVLVEGNWPRNFTITPNGDFLLVANQNSHNITVFRIDRESGIPEFTGKQIKIPSPVCLEFL